MSFARAKEQKLVKQIFEIDNQLKKIVGGTQCAEEKTEVHPTPKRTLKKLKRKLKNQRQNLEEELKNNLEKNLDTIKNEIKKCDAKIAGSQSSSPFVVQPKHYYEYERNIYNIARQQALETIKDIKNGIYSPTLEDIDPLMNNLLFKDYVLNQADFNFIDRVRILNYSANELSNESLDEAVDSAIFFYLDVIHRVHARLIKKIDDKEKEFLYAEISKALRKLSEMYLKHKIRFVLEKYKEAFSDLYIVLSNINKTYREQLEVFDKREQFENLKVFSVFLKKFASIQNNYLTMKAGLVGIAALYSLPLAGTLLFGACAIKAAEKLNECCQPRRLQL